MYDLPSEDTREPELLDEFHYYQPKLLRETFQPSRCPSDDVFVAADGRCMNNSYGYNSDLRAVNVVRWTTLVWSSSAMNGCSASDGIGFIVAVVSGSGYWFGVM